MVSTFSTHSKIPVGLWRSNSSSRRASQGLSSKSILVGWRFLWLSSVDCFVVVFGWSPMGRQQAVEPREITGRPQGSLKPSQRSCPADVWYCSKGSHICGQLSRKSKPKWHLYFIWCFERFVILQHLKTFADRGLTYNYIAKQVAPSRLFWKLTQWIQQLTADQTVKTSSSS